MGHENGDEQRPAKRRHVQGMLDETDPFSNFYQQTSRTSKTLALLRHWPIRKWRWVRIFNSSARLWSSSSVSNGHALTSNDCLFHWLISSIHLLTYIIIWHFIANLPIIHGNLPNRFGASIKTFNILMNVLLAKLRNYLEVRLGSSPWKFASAFPSMTTPTQFSSRLPDWLPSNEQ